MWVRTVAGFSEDDHWPKVVRLCLSTVVSFDRQVLNQDQLSRVKGGVLDSMSVSMLGISCGRKATLDDVVPNVGKV